MASSVIPTTSRPPNGLRAHSNSHTPTPVTTTNKNINMNSSNNGNNSNGDTMQVNALPPPSANASAITSPMDGKHSHRNSISASVDSNNTDRDNHSPNNHSTNNNNNTVSKHGDYQAQIQALTSRANIAERRLVLLENTLSLPLTYPTALPSPLEERPDVSAVLKDPVTGEMDTKLRQAALAVKECEIRTDQAQALVVQRDRELSRARQEIERLQGELNTVLAGRADVGSEAVSKAREEAARLRDEVAWTKDALDRSRDELHIAQNEITRLSAAAASANTPTTTTGGKVDRHVLQAWDEADAFLRLCEGRMAEARALFSRVLTGSREGGTWLPPLPPPHQQQPAHHYPPGPSPPTRDSSQRMPSPLMTRSTPLVSSGIHGPPPPPPPPPHPPMAYSRIPNQHPHTRHRRERSPGPEGYNVYEDDVREGERPPKRHRAISNAGRYYPEDSFRSPPGGSSHHPPHPPLPPPTNTVRQYNTYPDVAPSHPPSSHGPPVHPPPLSNHPSHPTSSQAPLPRHRSRSSSGSTSIDDMLLAASEVKPSSGGAGHDEYKTRERGASNASLSGGHYPIQPQQTQTHVFAPVQTGAPVKKGKTNPSLDSIPPSLAPQQFYPPTNEAGQRLCRQCGMTGRYKDNKCVEKWGPGPLGPGTVCDRCRKKMKRVERRGTLEQQQQQQQQQQQGGPGPGVYGHPISRTDTVIYPPPPPSNQHLHQSSQGVGGGQSSPVKESHHSHAHAPPPQQRSNPMPNANPMPSVHGNADGSHPPSSHTHNHNGNGHHNPPPQSHSHSHTHPPAHSTSNASMHTQLRRPSPPPPIEVLNPAASSRDAMDVDDHHSIRDDRGRGRRGSGSSSIRDAEGDGEEGDRAGMEEDEVVEDIDDDDADADGDGEDIEGELLDAVEAAEKSQGGGD